MTSSPRIPGLRLLHSPGPTHVPDAVVSAMARQPTDLADPRLPLLIAACESGMKALLKTAAAEVFFYAANGHGGWEAVIANLIAPGSAVLIPGTGHFSDSWAEQVEAFGGQALRTPYVEGYPVDPAALEAVLRDDTSHRIGAVFVVHTDTASGTTCDLARAAPRHRCGARIRRCSSSTSSPRSALRHSRWTSSASTSPSAPRRRA